MTGYPEHAKLALVKKDSEAIGDFLTWLQGDQHVHLMQWHDAIPDVMQASPFCRTVLPPLRSVQRPCRPARMGNHCHCWIDNTGDGTCHLCRQQQTTEITRQGHVPDGRTIEQFIAAYYDINLAAYEAENRAMLTAIREEGA